jgi:hypothetical protein
VSERPNVDNAADEKQVKKARKKERRKDIQNRHDIRQMLAADFGRRFLWRYLSKCNVFSTVQGPSPQIHFDEGFRQVGLDMMNDIIDANPEALVRMMDEANREKKDSP